MVMNPARLEIEGAPENGAIFLPWQQEITLDPELSDQQLGQLVFHKSIAFSMLHMDMLGPEPAIVAEVVLDDAPPLPNQDPRYRTHTLFFLGLIGGDNVQWQLHKSVGDAQPHVTSITHLQVDKHGNFSGWYGEYDENGPRFSSRLGRNYADSELPRYHRMLWAQVQRVLEDPQAIEQIEAAKGNKLQLENHLGNLALARLRVHNLNCYGTEDKARLREELSQAEKAIKTAGFAIAKFRDKPAGVTWPVSVEIAAKQQAAREETYRRYIRSGQLQLIED